MMILALVLVIRTRPPLPSQVALIALNILASLSLSRLFAPCYKNGDIWRTVFVASEDKNPTSGLIMNYHDISVPNKCVTKQTKKKVQGNLHMETNSKSCPFLYSSCLDSVSSNNCRTPDWQSSLVYWLENLEGPIFAWLFGCPSRSRQFWCYSGL